MAAKRTPSEVYVPELTPEGWQLHCPPPVGFEKRRGGAWLSSNDRDNWRKTGPIKKAWREIAAERGKGIPRHEKPYVVAELSFGDKRKRDDHNYMTTVKCIIDGLTDAGVWDDDHHGILLGPDLRWNESRPVGVTISIFERLW